MCGAMKLMGFSPVAAKARRTPGQRPYEAAGCDRARASYEPLVLGVFGFGPGFTLLMGLPPLTPSAIARRMSTSTISLLPTTFTLTPSRGRS
jgi:hypothetical protein